MLPVSGAEQLNTSDAEAHAAHDLGQRRVFHVGEASAVEFCIVMLARRHEEVPQTFLLRQRLEVVHDLRRDPTVAFRVLFLERLDVRVDMLVHEVRNAADIVLRLVAEFKVHGWSS